jgi:hypothetical protein
MHALPTWQVFSPNLKIFNSLDMQFSGWTWAFTSLIIGMME